MRLVTFIPDLLSRRIGFVCRVHIVLALLSSLAGADDSMIGVLTPRLELELEPRLEGRITAVHVRIGDRVDMGTVVAELDDEFLRQDLAQAEARMQAAQAELEIARTTLRVARDVLQRRERLVLQQAVSKESVYEAERDVALASVQVEQAQATVNQQAATVEQQRAQLRHTKLAAPFAGTIAERYGNPGESVGPGRPLVRLISNDSLRVRFAAPVDRAAELIPDHELRIRVGEFDIDLEGRISQVGSQVDPASGMIICEGIVEYPDNWAGTAASGSDRTSPILIEPPMT